MSGITEELREAMHYTNGYSFARDFSFEECCDRIEASFNQLQAENAKLRELVSDMWEACPTDGYYCIYHCEHYDKESESHCKLEARMAELGIEANT